jgi:hypothetical protein
MIGTAGNSPTGIYTPTVTASGGGLTATAPTSLTISPGPPALSSVTTDATLLTSAATTKVTVSLTAPAPTGGVLVNLASSNSAYLSVPTTPVTILAGNTSISTALATAGTVAAATPVTVTATGPSPFTPIRVNAGGVAYTDSFGRLWQADNGYQQGTMFSVSTPISGTPDPALYQTLRFSTTGLLQYQFNSIPSGTYQVTLKMAEIWFTSTNQRVFDVAINGTAVYPHLDIYAAAGANAPLDLAYPVTVTGGQIAITLTSIIGNPTVNAIEIVGWQAASQTAVTVVPPSISAVRVNAGGPAYTDSQGQFWSSNTSTSTYSTASPIAGTKDQTLYQSLLFSTSGPLSWFHLFSRLRKLSNLL